MNGDRQQRPLPGPRPAPTLHNQYYGTFPKAGHGRVQVDWLELSPPEAGAAARKCSGFGSWEDAVAAAAVPHDVSCPGSEGLAP